MNKITIICLALLLAMSYGCNKYVEFEDYFVAFDTDNSSSLTINESGAFIGAYHLHYCGALQSEAFDVKYSIIPGDGLKEGVDYKVITDGGKLSFLPGIYNLPIRISWLPNEIDEGKDNSIRIRIDACSNPDIYIGYPGPAGKGAELTIRKYKN